jgi:hypothetical protein
VSTARRDVSILLLLNAGLAACSIGTTAAKFAPALGPQGVTVSGEADRARFMGELLAVEPGGVLLLLGEGSLRRDAQPSGSCRVVRVLYASIDRLSAKQEGASVDGRRPPRERVAERLRLLSRFPRGLSDTVLRGLLDTCGQSRIAGLSGS